MTDSLTEFDEIAADDALIEAIRSGASADDLPGDDPAASLLVGLRDGAAAPDVEPEPAAIPSARRRTRRRRSGALVSVVAACALVVAGFGSAVAGDPAAGFKFLFSQGADLGSRFGSPAGDTRAEPRGGGEVQAPSPRIPANGDESPVRRGSAAAPWEDGTPQRGPVGFDRDGQSRTMPAPRGLEPDSDGPPRSRGQVDGFDKSAPRVGVPGQFPSVESNDPPDDAPLPDRLQGNSHDGESHQPESAPHGDDHDDGDDESSPETSPTERPTDPESSEGPESPTERPTEPESSEPSSPEPTQPEPTQSEPESSEPTQSQPESPEPSSPEPTH